jgi:hypothetical protein
VAKRSSAAFQRATNSSPNGSPASRNSSARHNGEQRLVSIGDLALVGQVNSVSDGHEERVNLVARGCPANVWRGADWSVLVANHCAAFHVNVGRVTPAQAAILTNSGAETSQAHRFPLPPSRLMDGTRYRE